MENLWMPEYTKEKDKALHSTRTIREKGISVLDVYCMLIEQLDISLIAAFISVSRWKFLQLNHVNLKLNNLKTATKSSPCEYMCYKYTSRTPWNLPALSPAL